MLVESVHEFRGETHFRSTLIPSYTNEVTVALPGYTFYRLVLERSNDHG